MTSATQNPSSPSATARSSAGSLQALNLGSLLVGQLGQAINWGNAENFQLPDRKPWVELPNLASAPQASIEAPLAPPADQQPTAQLVTETQTIPETTATVQEKETVVVEETTVVEETIAVEDAPSEVVAQAEKESEDASLVSEEISEPKDAPPEATEVETAPKQLEVEAPKQLPKVSTESLEPPSEPPMAQQAMNEQVEVEPAPEPIAEIAAVEPPEPEIRKPDIAAQSKPVLEEQEPPPSIAEPAKDADSGVSIPTTPKVLPEAAIASRNNEVESPPPRRVSLPNLRRDVVKAPSVVAPARPTSSSHTDDDYLTQLERLVLELNMELARVRGEQQEVDPMEQMANRIIALNLENLALREQLQRTSNPS